MIKNKKSEDKKGEKMKQTIKKEKSMEEMKQGFKSFMKWLSGLIGIAILVTVSMNVYIEGNKQKGINNSQVLFESMTIGTELPWTTEDNKIVAVIECENEKIFLSKSQSIGSEAIGCEYHLARDVEILISYYSLKPEARLQFVPIE